MQKRVMKQGLKDELFIITIVLHIDVKYESEEKKKMETKREIAV